MNPATSSAQSLERGRRAFATQAWSDAYEHLEAADGGQSLAVEDLERLATTAHMLGRADDATRAWERAHQAAVREGDIARAVRHAFHLVMGFGQRGEFAQAGGWVARAAGLVENLGSEERRAGKECRSRWSPYH